MLSLARALANSPGWEPSAHIQFGRDHHLTGLNQAFLPFLVHIRIPEAPKTIVPNLEKYCLVYSLQFLSYRNYVLQDEYLSQCGSLSSLAGIPVKVSWTYFLFMRTTIWLLGPPLWGFLREWTSLYSPGFSSSFARYLKCTMFFCHASQVWIHPEGLYGGCFLILQTWD